MGDNDPSRPMDAFGMINNGLLREPNSWTASEDGPAFNAVRHGILDKLKMVQSSFFRLRFYALIPHNFGLKAPPPINNQELLQCSLVPLQ